MSSGHLTINRGGINFVDCVESITHGRICLGTQKIFILKISYVDSWLYLHLLGLSPGSN